jgi:hypothetical protein
MKITLQPCRRELWEQFKDFHYQVAPLNKSSRTHLAVAEINGKSVAIGFCASLPMPSGTLKKAFRAHKVVVRMSECPAMFQLWATISDEQAKLHVREGKRFYSTAPILYAEYRDDPQSGWVPTTKDERRKRSGLRSHEYVQQPVKIGQAKLLAVPSTVCRFSTK